MVAPFSFFIYMELVASSFTALKDCPVNLLLSVDNAFNSLITKLVTLTFVVLFEQKL